MRSLWVALFPFIVALHSANSGEPSGKIVAWIFLLPVGAIIWNKLAFAYVSGRLEAAGLITASGGKNPRWAIRPVRSFGPAPVVPADRPASKPDSLDAALARAVETGDDETALLLKARRERDAERAKNAPGSIR